MASLDALWDQALEYLRGVASGNRATQNHCWEGLVGREDFLRRALQAIVREDNTQRLDTLGGLLEGKAIADYLTDAYGPDDAAGCARSLLALVASAGVALAARRRDLGSVVDWAHRAVQSIGSTGLVSTSGSPEAWSQRPNDPTTRLAYEALIDCQVPVANLLDLAFDFLDRPRDTLGPVGVKALGADLRKDGRGFVCHLHLELVQPGERQCYADPFTMLFVPIHESFHHAIGTAFRLYGCRPGFDVRWRVSRQDVHRKTCPLDGYSIGLAAALALRRLRRDLSSFDPAIAITGAIDEVGKVCWVEHISEKVTAAADGRTVRIIVPTANLEEAQRCAPPGLDICPADTVEEAYGLARFSYEERLRFSGRSVTRVSDRQQTPGVQASELAGVSLAVRAGWQEITDPDGKQKALLHRCSTVYRRLFHVGHRQPWGDFRDYIFQTQEALRRGDEPSCRDYFFVATVGDDVRGMAFLSTYPQRRLAFISYFGVLSPETLGGSRLGAGGFSAIQKKLEDDDIEDVLFEVEKVRATTPLDRQTRGRLLAIRHFQRRGARKIGAVLYEQPDLEFTNLRPKRDAPRRDRPEPRDLHLMVYRRMVRAEAEISRRELRRYLDFVYNTFYYDGLVQIDPDLRTKGRAYCRRLCRRVMRSVPSGMDRVPLVEVATRPLGLTVFVSCGLPQPVRLVERLVEELEDRGAQVIVRRAPSGTVAGASDSRIRQSDAVVAIVARTTRNIRDIRRDLYLAKTLDKPRILLSQQRVPKGRLRAVQAVERPGSSRSARFVFRAGAEYAAVSAVVRALVDGWAPEARRVVRRRHGRSAGALRSGRLRGDGRARSRS